MQVERDFNRAKEIVKLMLDSQSRLDAAEAAFKADDGFVQIVFAFEGDTAAARQVETSIQGKNLIEITAGLEKGNET